MLICTKIKNLLGKCKRTPSRGIKQNGLNIISWLRSSYSTDENRKSHTYRNINMLTLLLHFFFKYLLLPVVSVDFSRVSWTLGLIYRRHPFALGALCPLHAVKTVSPRNRQTLNAAVFNFPSQHSTQKVSLKLLIFCCAWNENKTREKEARDY